MKSAIATTLWLGLAALGLPANAGAGEAGDAVFADRAPWTLDQDGLTWSMHVEGPQVDGFLPVDDGRITLTEAIDPSDQKPVLQVVQKTDTRTRQIGPFPISGGDPVLIFFLEQTARDMARLTGGSPFYIRNRIKDAVFRSGQIQRDGQMATATFQPFAGDPNADRMGGFDTLTLTFVMDGAATPIRRMEARTQGEAPGYLNRLVLE